MKQLALGAMIGVLAVAATPGAHFSAAAQAVEPEYQLTSDVRRLAEQARVAISQNNFSAATSYLSQASGLSRTDGDRYVVATIQLDVGNRTFNAAQQIAAINALINSPIVGEAQRADLYYHRGRLAFHSQDANVAHDMLAAAVERGSANPTTYIALASLKTQRGDNAGALAMFDRAVELQTAAAVPIPDNWYRRAIDIGQRLGDPARVTQLNLALLAGYPSANNWRDALEFYRNTMNPDDSAAIDLWRLQSATGALAGERDYLNYARAASAVNALPEIERLVQAGRANSMLDGGNGEINALDRGTTRAAQALRNAIAGRASSAASSSTGVSAMSVADDYLTLGQYAEAAPLYRMAIEKGGVDTDLANLRLGMALALSGDTAGAQTALAAVTG
ncbi:MAG: hypothetical protein HKN78_12445, partial [Sphingomonadaceae bacterium]|nr:hypothetical protein [Sphingomonadaceae bacterium]